MSKKAFDLAIKLFLVVFVLGFFLVLTDRTSQPQVLALPTPICPTTTAEVESLPLVACGSVEQIYIVNAEAGAFIDVSGPNNYSVNADSKGGYIIRDVPAGAGYVVTVGDSAGVTPGVDPSITVTVLDPTATPSSSLYTSQTLGTGDDGYIRTRDGTFLDYYLELPTGGCSSEAPCDVLITYSGYSPGIEPAVGDWQNLPFDNFVPEGYAVMGVNMRGSGCSGGAFNLMEDIVKYDGYDMVETISAQDWVDDVILADKSWPGLSQLFVATTQPPSLDAIASGAPIAEFYREVMFPGGMLNIGFGNFWLASRDSTNAYPSANAQVAAAINGGNDVCLHNQGLRGQNDDASNHLTNNPYDDSYWQERSVDFSQITTPTLLVVAWQDPQTGSRVADSLSDIPNSTPKRLIGVNGGHNRYWEGEVFDGVMEFINTYARGDAVAIAAYEAEDPVDLLFDANNSGDAKATLSLPSLNEAGNGERLNFGTDLAADDEDSPLAGESTYNYDPLINSYFWTPIVQEQVTFTSDPLSEDKIMAGSGSVDLWFSAENTDVDIRATISELRSDGQEMFVQDSWLRASHRALDESKSTTRRPWHLHTGASNSPIVSGNTYSARLELRAFAHIFRKDSQIRVTIDAPPKGPGLAWLFDTIPGAFDVSIKHNSTNRSSIVLPSLVSTYNQSLVGDTSLSACDAVTSQTCRLDSYKVLSTVVDSSSGEDGSTAIVRFELNSEPTADVTIPLSISDSTEASISGGSITITAANWNNPASNEVVITGLDDNLADGNVAYNLVTGDPTSSDSNYGDLGASDILDVSLTNIDNEDSDLDGVTNGIEDAGPNGGDANGDGTQDSQQSNVSTYTNKVTNKYISAQVSGDCNVISTASTLAESDLSQTDSSYNYDMGLQSISISCSNPGESATVTYFLDKVYDTGSWKYRKFINGAYIDFGSQVTFGTANVGSGQVTTATFTLTDGGQYDEDGVANGEIIDPVGVAFDPNLATTGVSIITGIAVGVGCIVLSVYAAWSTRRKLYYSYS